MPAWIESGSHEERLLGAAPYTCSPPATRGAAVTGDVTPSGRRWIAVRPTGHRPQAENSAVHGARGETGSCRVAV